MVYPVLVGISVMGLSEQVVHTTMTRVISTTQTAASCLTYPVLEGDPETAIGEKSSNQTIKREIQFNKHPSTHPIKPSSKNQWFAPYTNH